VLEELFRLVGVDSMDPVEIFLPLYKLAAQNLHYYGKTKLAERLWKDIIQTEEISLAEDHPNRLASQHELAGAYLANNQIKEAVQQLEHVVKIEEISLAEDHPDRLASQHGLAYAYKLSRSSTSLSTCPLKGVESSSPLKEVRLKSRLGSRVGKYLKKLRNQ
jgi:hypothetical protein